MHHFLKLRKNKTFQYVPRYYRGGSHPFKIAHTLDNFRSTAHTTRGLANKLSLAAKDLKRTGDPHMKLRFFVILTVLVLGCLAVLNFDLSLFLNF